jgi:phospholipase C
VTGRLAIRLVAVAIALVFGISAFPLSSGASGGMSTPGPGQSPAPATFPITHFVIVMMENHAYDNLFGTYCQVYGPYCDNTGHGLNLTYCMPLYPNDPALGCHMEYAVPPTAQLTDIPHGWTSTPLAWNNGAMNNFYRAEWSDPHNYIAANETFSYYNTTGDALFSDIAEQYGLSDNFFSSNMSYSVPNHWFAQAGAAPPAAIHFTIGTTGLHQGNDTCNVECFDAEADFEDGQFTPAADAAAAETVDEAYLEEANTTATFQDLFNNTDVSWKYYDTPLNQNYTSAVSDSAVYAYWSPNLARAETYEPQFRNHYVAAGQFFTDASKGALPNVSWVIPTDPQSCHPPDTVGNCEGFVAQYINAVEKSPEWDSTAVFVTMDEYGGFYDGVAPPTVPALNGSGLGFRVPLLVVSPYTPQGYISHQLGYFESFLRTIEWKFGLPSLTVRDATAPLLTNFFDLNATPRPPMQFPSNYTQAAYPEPFQVLGPPNPPVMVHSTSLSPSIVELGWQEGSGGAPVNGWEILAGSNVYHLDRSLRLYNVTGLTPGANVPIYLESTDGPLHSTPVEISPGLNVTFQETGLPGATSWSVTLGGTQQTSEGSQIIFPESNGAYSFTVGSVPGYQANPSLGTVTVNGTDRNVSIAFTPAYSVTLDESGLPGGTPWNVTIGSVIFNSTSSAISFFEPNGTHSYLISTADREYSSPGGSFDVVGAAVSQGVEFSLVTYSVTFTETTLPLGDTWYLNITGGQYMNSTARAIEFTLPNGTYDYTAATGDNQTRSTSGSFEVNGAPLNESLTFDLTTYDVTFSESGIGNGTTWYVNITNWGSLSTTATGILGSAVSANLTNGTYAFSVASTDQKFAPAYTSPFVVGGGPVSVVLRFTEVTYVLSFKESGLPPGTLWNVTIGSATMNSTSAIAFTEPNGTYSFTVGTANGFEMSPSPGTVTVSGGDQDLTITLGPVYPVTFREVGLPAATPWDVTIGSIERNSTTSSLVIPEPNGTYEFQVGIVPGWSTRASSSVVVAGVGATVTRTFSPVKYSVAFTEAGLPNGTNWSVTVGATTQSGTSTYISFHLTNGSYSYFVANVANYSRIPNGSFSVSGAGIIIQEKFPLVRYVALFKETGLPSATNWSVTVGGISQSSMLSYISFHLSNGSYSYLVGNIPNYLRAAAGGLPIEGAGLTILVKFSLVKYTVTIKEYGLKTGTNWSVKLGATSSSSTTSSISLHLSNSSYSYSVPNVANYSRTPTTGTFTVTGGNLTVTVQFELVKYLVTFTESGLPSRDLWQIVFGSTTHSTTGPTLTFSVSNGTYTYEPTAPGSAFVGNNGSVTVNGATMGVIVAFSKVSAPWAGNLGGFQFQVLFASTATFSPTYQIALLAPPPKGAISARQVRRATAG